MEVEVGEDVDDAGPASGFFLFGLGWLLEEMLRELPFPCGLAPIWLVRIVGGPAADSTATGIGRLRNWALLASHSMINAPHNRGQKYISQSPDMTPFPHRSRDYRHVGRRLVMYFVHHRNTGGCTATAAMSYKLGFHEFSLSSRHWAIRGWS